MQDLNDLMYFAAVVKYQGYSAAARALNTTKSKLSKHVAQLEQELNIRLLERSSRKFRVTDVGYAFYRHCEKVLSSIEAAEAFAASARSQPSGIVRLSCPVGLVPVISQIMPDFHSRYREVRTLISTTNRRIDLVDEQIDLALRVGNIQDSDGNLIARKLGDARQYLVASPTFLESVGEISIETLGAFPTLSMNDQHATDTWQLSHTSGMKRQVTHVPIIGCGDFTVLERAAIAGVGIALLPDYLCERGIRAGLLAQVLLGWSSNDEIVHLVFTSRRGILPGVRALIDHLVLRFPGAFRRCSGVSPLACEAMPLTK